MKLKIFVGALIVLLISGALAGIKTLQIRKMAAVAKAMVLPPETVSAALVREEKWQDTLSAIGSISAVQGVTITPDIPGTVREIAFEAGTLVNKGDLLVRLDISAEEAQLRAVEAQVEWSRINLERNSTLRKENMLSQSDLDSSEAALKQNKANADAIRATIEKKTIRAPFTGRLGIRQINLGQYLDTGKPIVSLQALSPAYADFSLPPQHLARLKTGMRVRITTDAYPDRQFEGTLSTINPDLDAITRSVGLQATFDNADQSLRPGMYARVEVLMPELRQVLVVPATAVLSEPYGDSVFLIEPSADKGASPAGLTVRHQFIRTGRARGDLITVETGLKPGDRVVSSGSFKLRNGMLVRENNELAPRIDPTPKPPDA